MIVFSTWDRSLGMGGWKCRLRTQVHIKETREATDVVVFGDEALASFLGLDMILRVGCSWCEGRGQSTRLRALLSLPSSSQASLEQIQKVLGRIYS